MVKKYTCFSLFIVLLAGCATQRQASPAGSSLPPVEREFRAAWVATVANINWPSKPGLPVDSQKVEALRLLDFLRDHHFNAVILQVRPQADALFPSELEPWSYFLTGEQGRAPEPFYDPLAFWITEAHRRGLELHAWLNPYRAHHVSGKEITASSIVKKKPALVVPLEEGYWWFDPSLAETKAHATAVVIDLVRRYDIDGVHFDDYFYPYPSYNRDKDFPDSASWAKYREGGGRLDRGDWRREAVNDFIKNLYAKIKAEKKDVKFGLSPFGIWRPGHPPSIAGFDQYAVLYADAKKWLNEGWIDYFSPQLYWPISRVAQSFPVLLNWWKEQNYHGRHLWPGMSVGRDTSAKTVNETLNQVMITRGMMPADAGAIHWSISSVVLNPSLSRALLTGPYRRKALVPPSPWIDREAPAAPAIQIERKGDWFPLTWTHPDEKDVRNWVVYSRYGNLWEYEILPGKRKEFTLPKKMQESRGSSGNLEAVAIAAVDRNGNMSEAREIRVDSATVAEARLLILPRAAWHAAEPRSYPSHVPVRITVHHEGTKLDTTDDAAKKIRNIQAWGMGPDRKWADIPYHFLIAPDGRIYEGRNVGTVGETATEYDPRGHLLICCLGNLEQQPLPAAQRESLIRLIAYTSVKYQIPLDSLATHRDYSSQTNCPGKNLYQHFADGSIKRKAGELIER